MRPTLSVYLDVVRFLAATTVALGHYGVMRISGALFWQAGYYAHAAVLAFFVLSGFVIAYVAAERERSLGDYAASRFARIYSVALPALVVTVLADLVGRNIAPEIYTADWGYATDDPASMVLAALTFTGQSWFERVNVFSNLPWWSLHYEVFYYLMFGAVAYLQGWRRLAAAALLALAAGPKILLLLPIWLLGVAAWRLSRLKMPAFLPPVLAVVPAVILVATGWLNEDGRPMLEPAWYLPPKYALLDYPAAALLALHVVGVAGLDFDRLARKVQRPVRLVADLTFAVYLLHFPLFHLFSALAPGAPSTAAHRIFVLLMTGLAIWVLGRRIEASRPYYRRLWLRLATGQGARLDRGAA